MVKVYSTDTCMWCTKVKQYLNQLNVDFEDLNVGENINYQEEMIKKSHQTGVPVLDINGTIIIGFNKEAIDNALKIS
ncbi:MAG: glutathione S-transferase N-terminal domain-containing protein [Clostridium sp.]|nr:glutathione S-transferase N-terminal domain-containing protein [Clostridium sp.]MDY3828521.1 glutaredoxin domain-containing protein [Clostridium sp.]